MAFAKLYLTNVTAPYTPATFKGAWDDTAGAVTRALDTTKRAGGATATVARAETNASATWDVCLYRGVSGPLDAQTINCNIDQVIGCLESSASADLVWHIHAYVTQGDSDLVRGTLINDYVETTAHEWPTTITARALAAAQASGSLAVSAGDRLVFEIGYQAKNSVTTSFTGTLRYGTEASANDKTQLADAVAGTSPTSSSPFVTFSASIADSGAPVRDTQALVESVLKTAPDVRGTASYVEAIYSTLVPVPTEAEFVANTQNQVETVLAQPVDVRATQSYVEALVPNASFELDGEVPTGTNPAAGALPSDTPQVFCTVSDITDGTIVDVLAEEQGGPFNDRASYYGGFKEARLSGIDSITRKCTTPTGGIQATATRFVFNDADRKYRAQWGSARLRGRKWDTFIVGHGARLAEQAPYRVGAQIVRSHNPVDGFKYEVVAEGMLSRHISDKKREKKIPQNVLGPLQFPALAEKFSDGWSPAIGYGVLEDETSPNPQGVCKGTYVGTAHLRDVYGPTAADAIVDFYVFFGHAVAHCFNCYITVPAWTPDTPYLVGDVIRPSGDGGNGWRYQCVASGTTGSSAPTFPTVPGATVGDGSVTWRNIGADDPSQRVQVPHDAWGQVIGHAHKPGWAAATGSPNRFTDYNGYRYDVAVVLSSHRFARSLREGSMTLSGNFLGIEDVGDGTGAVITSPPRVLQHFVTNFVEHSYKTGAWFPVPTFGTYSLFDTSTIEAVKTYGDHLGISSLAIVFGSSGRQDTAFNAIQQILTSGDFEIADNRHGQIITTMEDPTAAGAVALTDQANAVGFRQVHESGAYANVVRYRYGYRYVPNVAQVLTGAQGQPLPARPQPESSEWVSGLVTITDDDAIAANDGVEVYLDVDLYGVRDASVASVVAHRILRRARGPEGEGPVSVEIVTDLEGLKQLSTEIDVGTVVTVTHAEGLGPSGAAWQIRVREFKFEPLALRTTLVGRLLFTP